MGKKKLLKPIAVPYRYNVKSEEEPSILAGTDQLQLLTPTKTYHKPSNRHSRITITYSFNYFYTAKKKISNFIQIPSSN